MLSSLRTPLVRQALVIVLMALSVLVVAQRAQAGINDVQHGLSIEHAAPAFAPSADHDHVHDDAGSGHENGAAGVEAGTAAGDGPGPHHHHTEGPQVANLPLMAPETVTLAWDVAEFFQAEPGSPRFAVFGLDRPPRPRSAARA
jgi:hypothetical protein